MEVGPHPERYAQRVVHGLGGGQPCARIIADGGVAGDDVAESLGHHLDGVGVDHQWCPPAPGRAGTAMAAKACAAWCPVVTWRMPFARHALSSVAAFMQRARSVATRRRA